MYQLSNHLTKHKPHKNHVSDIKTFNNILVSNNVLTHKSFMKPFDGYKPSISNVQAVKNIMYTNHVSINDNIF